MGSDIYLFLFIFIIVAMVAMVAHLAWLSYKKRPSEILPRKIRFYSLVILYLLLGVLSFELLLMIFFDSSYYDVFDKVSLGLLEWKPSLAYQWMLVHRAIIILLLILSLYLVLSKRKHFSIVLSHIKRIKENIFSVHDNAVSPVPVSIKLIVMTGIVAGSYFLTIFFMMLFNNLAVFDLEYWSYATGFHSHNFYQIANSLILLAVGCLFIVTSTRLLYLKLDAWWLSMIILSVYAFFSLRSVVYFYHTSTYGGLFNLIISLLFSLVFVVLISLIWNHKALYKVKQAS